MTTLELEDDAAYQDDNSCRMPTKADFDELLANTTSTWKKLNGVNGRRFTSEINGNSIFVPAAGGCDSGSVDTVGSFGVLWSSSLDESDSRGAWSLGFDSGYVGVGISNRYYGFTVRPVQDPNTTAEPKLFNPADYITKTELDKTVKQLTIKTFVSTILANDASNEDIINKINELINGLISIGIIENES